MDQGYLKFNPERLDQTYHQLVLRESTPEYDEYVCKRKTNDYHYIARRLKTNQIDNIQFAKLRKIKLYNILPVLDLYRDEKTLVSQDFDQYSLFNNSQHLEERDQQYVAALASITLQELCYRGFPFRINPKRLFIIGKHVCVQQIDFEFNHKTTEQECFASFLELLKYLQLDIDCVDFEEATNALLEKLGVETGLTENMPYAEFLEEIFLFQNCESMVKETANSFVYVFDTPDFLKTIPGLAAQTVLKSTKIDHPDADQDYLIKCADRELRMMENFRKYEPLATCFAYFRVQKQLYLFMELYAGDLEQAFQNSFIYERNVKDLCCQLAVAVRHLHKYRIIHRDLKPANLFLSHEDLDRAKLLIADFDHSIEIDNAKEGLQTLNAFTGLTGSTGYEPPEAGKTDYDYKADIWQIGMIFYQIANQGVYPVQFDTLYVSKQNLEELSDFKNIKKKLEDKDVSDEFVQLIAACLSCDPKNRPDSQQLIEMLIECFDDLGIDDEDTLQSTHQISMVESYGQLVQKTIPLRMLKSANL